MRPTNVTLRPELMHTLTRQNDEVFVSSDLVMMHSLHSLLQTPMRQMIRTPQYVEMGRVILVSAGQATYDINLVPYQLKANDVWVIPQNSYISLTELSDEFDGMALSFQHLPVGFDKCALLHLKVEDYCRIQSYLELVWQVVRSRYDQHTIEHLQIALMYDLMRLRADTTKPCTAAQTHGEQIVQRFLDLLGLSDPLPRNVKAYAQKLCITPNHLSAVIRQQTGKSVMDWLNANCVLRAQVMLKHSDMPVCDIACQLGFQSATFFSRYFRRETGMTPSEYRFQDLDAEGTIPKASRAHSSSA